MEERENVLGVVQQLNIIDDTFFQKMAEDDNHTKRVRYNISCITANITEPGTKFEKVRDVIGIYISKFDMFKSGKTVYHVDRVIRETGEVQDNGPQEVYVNTKIDDGSDIAELMRIFKEKDTYDFKKFPKVSRRKKQFKENEGGSDTMCDLVENYAKDYAARVAKEAVEQTAKQTAKDNALRLFQNGADYELVRSSITSLSDEELQNLYREALQCKTPDSAQS